MLLPFSTVHGACRSPSPVLLGLEEVVEHLLELRQVVGGIDGEAGLEVEGEQSGVDVDHSISQLKWDVAELESLKTLISFC